MTRSLSCLNSVCSLPYTLTVFACHCCLPTEKANLNCFSSFVSLSLLVFSHFSFLQFPSSFFSFHVFSPIFFITLSLSLIHSISLPFLFPFFCLTLCLMATRHAPSCYSFGSFCSRESHLSYHKNSEFSLLTVSSLHQSIILWSTFLQLHKLQLDNSIGYVLFLPASLCLVYKTVFSRERRGECESRLIFFFS